MLRKIFIIVLLLFGLSQGIQYLYSDKFQAYADRTKASWTNKVTLWLGHSERFLDDPRTARSYYEKIVSRAPKSHEAEEAMFGMAQSWDENNRSREALEIYTTFVQKYEKSPRVPEAARAIDRLKNAHFF